MYRNKYIKYKSKYLDLQSFIDNNKIGGVGLPDEYDEEDPAPLEELLEEPEDYEVNYKNGPPQYGGGRTKTNSVCKLCNNKCNSVICNKCLKTEKGNVFIEQLYGGDLSETSDSESE